MAEETQPETFDPAAFMAKAEQAFDVLAEASEQILTEAACRTVLFLDAIFPEEQ